MYMNRLGLSVDVVSKPHKNLNLIFIRKAFHISLHEGGHSTYCVGSLGTFSKAEVLQIAREESCGISVPCTNCIHGMVYSITMDKGFSFIVFHVATAFSKL